MRAEMKTGNKAETIALDALTFIVSDEAEISRFLGLTGMDPATLRQTADTRATLSAVLDYVLGHEATARQFAEQHGYRPEDLARAAYTLSST